jgi:hypothetical protein
LVIFEDHTPYLVRFCNRILQDLREIKYTQIVQPIRIARPPLLEWNLAVGFFDGASQCKGQKCGVGVILKCPVLSTFSIKMMCGTGTNTKGELLALWCILYFSCFKKVKRLQLVGDTKIIIDWFSHENNLQVVTLQS